MRFPVRYIDQHEWMGPALCPAFNGEQIGLRTCICGAQRWHDADGIEHALPGWVPHPIRQALGDPGWEALLAIVMGRACPVGGYAA